MQHLAMIMDGNRRWAKAKKFASIYHRKEAIDALKTAAKFCIQKSIPHLSLFMLSLENAQNRSLGALENIFRLTVKTCADQCEELVESGIKVEFVGDRSLYPANVMPAIEKLEEQTKYCDKLSLSLLFYYGGQQEIVYAAKSLALKVSQGKLALDDISIESINNNLWTAHIPHPDLIIRTGAEGATRLSNFLLFQAAYSELQFLDCFWPEITHERLEQCLIDFNKCSRNLGK